MRTTFPLLGLLSLLLLSSCHDFGPGQTGPFDSMFLERVGAGDLSFSVIPTSNADSFQVHVTHREFRDTTIDMVLLRSDTSAQSFDALVRALSGDVQITGDFRQSSLPTGTWVRVYMIQGQTRFEVTNIGLRNTLLPFEQLVRSRLGNFQPLAS